MVNALAIMGGRIVTAGGMVEGSVLVRDGRIVEIGAGAERPALGGEHRGPDFDVAVELLQCVGDLVDQRDVEEVQRRPLDFDGADMADLCDADVRELAHG